MNIKVKGIDIEVTDAIREYAEKKISEAIEKFSSSSNQDNIFVEVELLKTNNRQTHGDVYKTGAKVSGIHQDVFVEVVKDDLYASIDELKDKLEQKIYGVRGKKKTLTHKIALKFKKLFKKLD